MKKHCWESINRGCYNLNELSASSLLSEIECALNELTDEEVSRSIAALDAGCYQHLAQFIVAGFKRLDP